MTDMNALPSLALSSPWWIVLLPLPWLLRRLQRWRDHRRPVRVPAGLVPWALRPLPLRWGGPSAWRLAWLALVLAMARPVITSPPGPGQPQKLIDIVTIVDISPSMAATDTPPSRLAQAQRTWHDLHRLLPPSRSALIAYAAEAYRLLPLTTDLDVVGEYIDSLSTAMTRRTGSNLAQAFTLAAEELRQSPDRSRAILLLSDGEVFAPEAARRALAATGIPLYSIGIGTPIGAPVRDAMGDLMRDPATGRVHVSRLRAAWLERLARQSGGVYRTLSADDDVAALARHLSRLEGHPVENSRRIQTDLAPVLIVLALVCLIHLPGQGQGQTHQSMDQSA